MIKINASKGIEQIEYLKKQLKRVVTMDWDYQDLMALQTVYDHRVWDLLKGSEWQNIGLPPTPMYETLELRNTLKIDKEGMDMPIWGWWIEWGYNPKVNFGPIWDPTGFEIPLFESIAEKYLNEE